MQIVYINCLISTLAKNLICLRRIIYDSKQVSITSFLHNFQQQAKSKVTSLQYSHTNICCMGSAASRAIVIA